MHSIKLEECERLNLRCDFLLELDAIWPCHSWDVIEMHVVGERLEGNKNFFLEAGVSDHNHHCC